MSRVFRRGELRTAIISTLAQVEPANGYTIMQALADAIGGGWRPSPGAIYPAILGLEDAGLLVGTEDETGTRTYRLTDAGRAAADDEVLDLVSDRARTAAANPTLGSLLDGFAAGNTQRATRLDPPTARRVKRALDKATERIAQILEKETTDG